MHMIDALVILNVDGAFIGTLKISELELAVINAPKVIV